MNDEKKTKAENLHKNHRANMRQVYYKSGLESLPDHTVLELLLYFGIPMKDTNETAHLLLERFGSFSAVLRADISELRSVKGMTENAACLISMLLPLFRRYSDDLGKLKKALSSPDDVADYIRPKFIDSTNERLFAVFTDASDRIIACRLICEGHLSSASFDFRSLVSACLETKASNVFLAHNHPSGIALPSADDIELTRNVCSFLKVIDVALRDHLIIAGETYTSMASIPKFSELFI